MRVAEALAIVRRIFLDSAPVIYHVEGDATYRPLTDVIFLAIEAGVVETFASEITLAECLVLPIRNGDEPLVDRFKERFASLWSRGGYASLDEIGLEAAELRARYNLKLPDAFQLAAAIAAGCDGFLTNDVALKRVPGINVMVLGEMEP